MSGDAKTCDADELIKVLQQLPEGILVLNGEATIQFANKTGARLVKIKPKTAVGSTFPHEIVDGTMRDFDVEMTVKEITWAGESCRLLHLKSLKSSGAFHLEWKLEAAVERAREAEDALAALQAAGAEVSTQPSSNGSVDSAHYEERINELEALLELAEVRADEMQSEIARDDHQQATELQDALTNARDAEEQVRQLEEDLAESRERVRTAEEQAEVAEERAYSLEAELEEVLANNDDKAQAGAEAAELEAQLRAQLEEHSAESERLRQELEAEKTRASELEESLDKATSAFSETNDESLAKELEISELKAELERVQAESELQAANQLSEGQAALEQVQAEAAQAQQQVTDLQAQLATHLQSVENSESENLQRVAELEEQLRSAQEASAALTAEAQERAEREQVAEKKLTELEEQLALATEESEELAEQMRLDSEQFESQSKELKAKTEELEGQAQELEAKAKELEESLAKSHADLEAAESARDSLLQELEDAAKATEEQSVEAADLQGKVAELEANSVECESLRKDVRRLETLLENAEELAQKGQKVEKLERKLEGALRRAEEAEERLTEERRLLNELKAKAEKMAVESREGQALTGDSSNPETERLAFQDELTGLPNRNIIQRYLGFMLKQSARYDRLTAMLRIDCDNFKTISDTFGVEIGDELIRSVGERLSSVVRGSDVLGRYGEDEFIMLISELNDQDEASVITAAIIKRIYQKLRKPFQVSGQNITVGASVGVSLYPLDAVNGEEMFEHAGVALKRAKSTGRGQAQYFTPELQSAHDARNVLDSDLRRGLEEDQFEMLFQPILDLSNGQIVGVEALIRWKHPTHGTLNPDDFLQVAEDSGMIVLIGNWALKTALQHAAKWHHSGLGIFVSVNLSRRQLLQADLLPTVQSVLAEMRCSPDRLLLEIPEELTGKDLPKVREALVALQQLGVRLAVDNFGTASTSLQDMRQGPFQVIKVDRSFVRGVPKNEENTGIVLSALTVGHHLGRVAIAVGVETEAEKTWLAQTGCRFAQGNHLSPPLLPSQVAEFGKRT